ncbi:MAG: phosphohistidine phosphatase [Betaproteobacteria bacterium HGW-Betaproteobacteria-22]|nr:MAG: phosphohistidine phosphatase [Betaproteobacteria bacterium HGW-Betaproteobacteria-22]
MKQLIFWRHAEAEVESASGKDADRALTKRGRKDAENMAKWLAQYLPDDVEIWASPALRCQETASALQKRTGWVITASEVLGIHSNCQQILDLLHQFTAEKTVVFVGHQPNLGLCIASLLKNSPHACAVKKGSVWWLRRPKSATQSSSALQMVLYAVQQPALI